jgi:hypothetical protein
VSSPARPVPSLCGVRRGRGSVDDGIESMDYDAVTYSFSPSIDARAEFKVETSSYSAQSGEAPGARST